MNGERAVPHRTALTTRTISIGYFSDNDRERQH